MTSISLGVDYSLTGPSITKTTLDDNRIISIETFTINKRKEKFVKKAKRKGIDFSITIVPYPSHSNDIERYDKVASLLIQTNYFELSNEARLENYSFNSISSSKHKIYEACGIFKHMVFQKYGLLFDVIAPNSLKKDWSSYGGTKKGMGKKEAMANSFKDRFGFFIHDFIERGHIKNPKEGNPQSDIVDSIALSLYGVKFDI